MYKNGFGINNLQWLIRHKTKPKQIQPNNPNATQVYMVSVIMLVLGPLWPGVVLPVGVAFIGQIELFKNHSY